MDMFCYQCEQTACGRGCDKQGVCGKDAATAGLQDILTYVTKGVGQYAARARALGAKTPEADKFVVEALFTTVTNVNFDADRIERLIRRAVEARKATRAVYEDACRQKGEAPEAPEGPAQWIPAAERGGLLEQAAGVGVSASREALGEDLAGLRELLLYGLKGTAAYVEHARILGREDDSVYAFFHAALDYLAEKAPTVERLLALSLKCGEVNLAVMGMLDAANTGAYGTPVPTPVRTTPVKGKAILVSGHDLKDLADLLEQTKGLGVNVYTHCEMLPAHGYPELKKHPHLVGNYGGSWPEQGKEFAAFPGAILMTTNCLQKPQDGYKARIFTSGLVAWPGVAHIGDGNFKPVIDAALAAPGFGADEPEKTILVGFGHGTVLGVADKVVEAVKGGLLKHFFLIGGCDGAKPGRNYYTELAEAVPKDCAILTLACGKFRFNKLDFGDIGGIPRLLDCGQCNDAYSAIKVAVALAGAFGCGVNDLPLSLILSWYEQKACAILLTLLHLGIKGIRLGPSLPAFVTPAVLNVLVEKFDVKPTTTAREDLKAILGQPAA